MWNKIIRYIFFAFPALFLPGIHANGQGRNDTTVVITDTTNIDALFKKSKRIEQGWELCAGKADYDQNSRAETKLL